MRYSILRINILTCCFHKITETKAEVWESEPQGQVFSLFTISRSPKLPRVIFSLNINRGKNVLYFVYEIIRRKKDKIEKL